MIYDLMGFIIFLIVVAVIIGVVSMFANSGRRDYKSKERELKAQLAAKSRQLHAARGSLSRIAANNSGNPALDAQLALDEVFKLEDKELES